MVEFKRHYFTQLRHRLLEKECFIQLITGPRQVGKTTVVRQLFADAAFEGVYVVAEDGDDTSRLDQWWQRAAIVAAKSNRRVVLAIDEVQKIPQWSERIKRLYDEAKFNQTMPFALVLLGSSHWLLQRGTTESLAGRFEQTYMSHWTFSELKEAFDSTPEQYVYFGAYPGSMGFRSDEARWAEYIRNALIETTITKDVLLMTRIDKPALLRRVFELGARYSAQTVSYTKMLGQLQDAGNTVTLAHYLELLGAAGLLTGLPKFANQEMRSRASSPKLQVQNNALMSVFANQSFAEAQIDRIQWGRRVESAVGAHLLSHAGSDLEISYWNEGHAEVDFVLRRGNQLLALEVKSGHDKITGLKNFSAKFPHAQLLQLDDRGIAWQDFIAADPRDFFRG
jgi:predicted AAA+ superfamily ATPase